MNKKSREALKDAFNIPEPDRKEQFLNSLEIRQQKRFPAHLPMYVSAVATVVIVTGIWGSVKNLPYFDQPEVIDKPVYSIQATQTENHTGNNIIQTTVASYVKDTSTDTSAVTQTLSVVKTSGTVTVTETTTTSENKKPPEMSAVENQENTNDEEIITTAETEGTDSKETTVRHTTAASTMKTTVRYTTATSAMKTTARHTTTVSTATKHTTVATTTSEDELNVTTTTSDENNMPPAPQTTSTSINYESVTTSISDDKPSLDIPPPDYTVNPPVRYSPSDDAVIIESDGTNTGTDFIPNPGQTTTHPEPQYDLGNLIDNSDLIVIATTYEVISTGINGIPYTQENISVSEVIYGDIPNNASISVYGLGGYIPAEEFSEMQIPWAIEQNRTLYVPYGNKTFAEVGDTCIYFLKRSNDAFPEDSYILTGLTDISKFRYNRNSCTNLNNNSEVTKDEIKNYLNQ